LLLVAIGFGGFLSAISRGQGALWFSFGQAFLFYGVFAGLLGAAFGGGDVIPMVRDLIPFGFMFLPLFMAHMWRDWAGMRVVLVAFLLLGIVFSARTSGLLLGIDFYFGYEALSYLANSPAVLFSALFLCGCGLARLSKPLTFKSVLVGAALVLGGLVVFIPVVMTAQRASMAAFVVYNLIVFGFLFLKAPRRMSVIGIVIISLIAVFMGELLGGVFDVIARKSEIVGDNQRIEDVIAVWTAISHNPMTLLFGLGWGASFESPAVMDIEVYFTHSLLSSMLLKIGIIGLLLCCCYVGALFLAMFRGFKGGFILILGLSAPFLIDVFLYAAFKSLDFGILLLLISAVVFFQKGDEVIASDA